MKMLKAYENFSCKNGDIEVQLKENEIYFMPYSFIRVFVEKGEAELIWTFVHTFHMHLI